MSYSQKLMDRCVEHALKNPIESRGRNTISRMAAIIFEDGYYLGGGWNKYKTHPLAFKFSQDHAKIYLHAELAALIDMPKKYYYRLSDCEIYIARVLKDGTSALAKPCSVCYGALTYFGINPENIYYTR